jgi:hypothetical protein
MPPMLKDLYLNPSIRYVFVPFNSSLMVDVKGMNVRTSLHLKRFDLQIGYFIYFFYPNEELLTMK